MSSGKWWPLLIMVEPERNRSLPVIYKWPLIQTFILLKAFNGFFQGQPQLSYSSWLLTLHFLGLHTGGETLPFWWLSICIFRHLWDVILMCLAKISVLSLSQIWNIFFQGLVFMVVCCSPPFYQMCNKFCWRNFTQVFSSTWFKADAGPYASWRFKKLMVATKNPFIQPCVDEEKSFVFVSCWWWNLRAINGGRFAMHFFRDIFDNLWCHGYRRHSLINCQTQKNEKFFNWLKAKTQSIDLWTGN